MNVLVLTDAGPIPQFATQFGIQNRGTQFFFLQEKKKKIKTVITARFLFHIKAPIHTNTGKNDNQFPGDGVKPHKPHFNIWSDV